ncbi:phosphoribosyltransferase [Streptomyces fragilis]|uniref:Phosphoribosyltransferase n=1 Tax=Streptomyces fragilis TaxID=67301 RepID=A0ABV2YC67_9ACTN|nr:phosphoribosyltransferase [Streptomyces fragilis]
MNQRKAAGPLTVGRLARELVSRAGRPMPALRCYESLTALWVRVCDTGLPGAGLLQVKTLRTARRLTAGEDTVIAPSRECVPGRLLGDESLVRMPASLAVQGVEWQDTTALAERWLQTNTETKPVLVAGVRTGGAYLAPLVAAQLKAAGVDTLLTSVRPGGGGPPLTTGRNVLLVDDPPLTGRTLLALAKEVAGPGGVEVLVPVFTEDDVRPLRDAGVQVTVLPRERWQSTRRLQPNALASYMDTCAEWLGPEHRTPAVVGVVPGRENSALTPWPGVRHRSPARAVVRLRTAGGVQRAVAGWVPPGIFGDAARATATEVSSPVPPATLAVGRALVLSEELRLGSPLGPDPEHHLLEEAVDYVLARAEQLPVETTARTPIPAVLHTLAQALHAGTATDTAATAQRLHHLLAAHAPTLPDNRCEAEKWLIDDNGRLRKTGHLTHAYRRDNELLTPLIDLAALSVAFGRDLQDIAESVERRLGGKAWHAALAVALLCYGMARGEQLPRTYNPERAAEAAVEAFRLQRGMGNAAVLLQKVLRYGETGPDSAAPRVVNRWQRPPDALVQPRLPFDGAPAAEEGTGLTAAESKKTESAVATWAGQRFLPVHRGDTLLLAPLGSPARWPEAETSLTELASLLPHPQQLFWCGVPAVRLQEAP